MLGPTLPQMFKLTSSHWRTSKQEKEQMSVCQLAQCLCPSCGQRAVCCSTAMTGVGFSLHPCGARLPEPASYL